MSTSKRIFVAAWEYPPILSGESVVCRRTLEHSKFDYDLCCGPIDGTGDNHVRLFPTGGNKYLQWPFRVARQFKALDAVERYDVMMSRVMPPNGHLAGWLIKRMRPRIKWVVYFSDPVWNSPFLKPPLWLAHDHRPNWLLMKVFGIPAKWAVREGDLLVFNNERLARYVLGRHYGRYREKVVIAPYGHEGLRPRPAPRRGDGKFRLTHVGQLYGNRTLEAVVNGAAQLKRQRPELYKRLSIRQVGFVSEAELRRVRKSEVAEAFEFVGQVPYAQSMEEMYQSDCLLVIDPVFDRREKNIYIPGKLFDYISTGRPVLCIADADSATGDVAKRLWYRMAKGGGAVCGELVRLLEGDLPETGSNTVPELYCGYGAGFLDDAIEKLILA